MRQLTFTQAGELEWREVEPPRIESDGQALVRPVAVATCDLDLALIRGRVPVGREFAFGHEGVAEVLEVGDSVEGVAPGELVSVPFQISCGHCARCRKGQTGNCESVEFLSSYGLPLGPDNGGLLSDVVRVPFADAMLVALPEAVEPAAVASLSDNIPDAWRTVAPQLEEYPGARVLICAGAGSIALYAGSIALALGASGVDFAGGGPVSASWPRGVASPWPTRSSRSAWGPIRSPSTPARTEPGCSARCAPPSRTESARRSGSTSSPRRRCRCSRCTPAASASTQGAVHARPAMEPILELVRSGRFEPETVTRERAGWEDAAEAVASHSAKLVISRLSTLVESCFRSVKSGPRRIASGSRLAAELAGDDGNRFQGMPSDGDSRAGYAALGREGWIGLHWPERLGGRDADPLLTVAVEERFGYHWLPLSGYLLSVKTIGNALLGYASEPLQERLLARDRRGPARVLSGLLRAGGRLGPRLAAHQRAARR